MAEIFAPEEQEDVVNRIGGFKQQIQLEMIKRSGGNLSKLDGLRTQALEGAFDTRVCRGLDECPFIPYKEGDLRLFKNLLTTFRAVPDLEYPLYYML